MPDDFEADRAGRTADEPEVIVVPYRAGKGSALFLPPLLILMLGSAFFVYRARSSHWRGVSSLFDSAPAKPAAETPATELALKTEPSPPPQLPVSPEAPKEPSKAREQAAAAVPEPPTPKPPEVDPLDDIRREAEKTRERIAELEKLKEQASRKLDETADERKEADRLAHRKNRNQKGIPIPPQMLQRLRDAQREQLAMFDQQIARMEQFQRQQLQRWGLNDRNSGFANGRMLVPRLAPSPPSPLSGFGLGLGPELSRFRQGPDGIFRPAPGNEPPPPPQPRVID
jgi:hypothetical protein